MEALILSQLMCPKITEQTRKNAAVECLDYQIPVRHLKGASRGSDSATYPRFIRCVTTLMEALFLAQLICPKITEQTRNNAVVECLDYQISVTHLKGASRGRDSGTYSRFK